MKIRLLESTPSSVPDFPFQPGQVIEVTKLTPEMRAWLKVRPDGTVRAVLLPDDDREVALDVGSEQPEPVRRKGR